MTIDIFGPEYAMPALTRAEIIALVVRQLEQPHEPGQASMVVTGDEGSKKTEFLHHLVGQANKSGWATICLDPSKGDATSQLVAQRSTLCEMIHPDDLPLVVELEDHIHKIMVTTPRVFLFEALVEAFGGDAQMRNKGLFIAVEDVEQWSSGDLGRFARSVEEANACRLPVLYVSSGSTDSRERVIAEPQSLADLVLWKTLPR